MKKELLIATIMGVSLVLTGCNNDTTAVDSNANLNELVSSNIDLNKSKVELGRQLYLDTSLSKNRTMSCATCHDLDHAMIDPRATSMTLGASLDDDNISIGDRNSPTVTYAAFSPEFHFDEEEWLYIGGQFYDGRAKNLKEQAKGPFLNSVEMMMPDEEFFMERIKENPKYVAEFKRLYGENIFDDPEKAYDASADAISMFEKSEIFAPFDSKFDRFLAGKEQLSEAEQRGLELFNGRAKCNLCHISEGPKPLFTDFTYDNLGVPINHALRTANGKGDLFVDEGLYENPEVQDEELKGSFKVSTLRNIAITGHYMYNGVFKELKTVVHFYNTMDASGAINPETGETWEAGEEDNNKNIKELGDLGLSDQEEMDLVAFLKTLTDARYEHLIP